ncbi:hypothetical protein HELRODRAFT_188628 [Helobdella robusta]|uniref:Elongation of very long chain fatty acids protein n=1 Tax=Helobdella robusta TaxID=6412 RepID=T1FQ70_HELRO|nr:hypothetical protein HELRODRAFT_188628 [Helobdella robusta]ESO02220.1 hypothetical protein HELRODRAFT_188628 [Helobdella robusta]
MAKSNSTSIPLIRFFQQENWYHDLFIKYGDPRTTNSFLLRTPEAMLIIVILYLIFVVAAPRIMEKRPAMDLKKLIIVYNFALVGLSGYMCVEFLLVATLLGYSYSCQPVDWEYKRDSLNMRSVRKNLSSAIDKGCKIFWNFGNVVKYFGYVMINVSWLFFFSKIVELADTVFFILRKKNSQVTFLHVYHHATMIINWWMAAKYVPIGQSFFVGVVNSFIHTLMYVYYALAALGPEMQKYLWWKKYMTKLQLIQFVLVVSHTGNNLFYRMDCDYPWLYNTITFYYTWSMLFLFLNFYYQTYISRKRADKVKKEPTKSKLETEGNGHVKEVKNNGEKLVRSRKTNGFVD